MKTAVVARPFNTRLPNWSMHQGSITGGTAVQTNRLTKQSPAVPTDDGPEL